MHLRSSPARRALIYRAALANRSFALVIACCVERGGHERLHQALSAVGSVSSHDFQRLSSTRAAAAMYSRVCRAFAQWRGRTSLMHALSACGMGCALRAAEAMRSVKSTSASAAAAAVAAEFKPFDLSLQVNPAVFRHFEDGTLRHLKVRISERTDGHADASGLALAQ